MSKDDPYHDRKIYHMAALVNDKGGVSALCYAKPRAINLRTASWTIRPDAVTCKLCKALMKKDEATS